MLLYVFIFLHRVVFRWKVVWLNVWCSFFVYSFSFLFVSDFLYAFYFVCKRCRIIKLVLLLVLFLGGVAGVKAPSVIADGLIELATALGATSPANVNERAIRELERALSPILSIILSAPICDLPHAERIAAIREKIEACHLTVKPSTSSSTTSTITADGEKSTASGKLLISQLTRPDAVDQLQFLAEYRISSEYDPTSLLEMAHSGRWTPEVRVAKVKAVAALDPRARATAEAAIAANDERAPVCSCSPTTRLGIRQSARGLP